MIPTESATDREFCYAILPEVSRTFALGIRLLPAGLEHAVLTAYLLCRIADTIEDAPVLTPRAKQDLLMHYREVLEEHGPGSGRLRDAFPHPHTAEERLAADADRVLREFRSLPAAERSAIRPWVQEMAAGMAEFAAGDGDDGFQALQSIADLDRYCYYVAGTVGHLLTGLFRLYAPGMTQTRFAGLERLATSFGLGLQLTNIIKDVADDQRRGWSFVPRDLCAVAGLRPSELHDPALAAQAREVMTTLIGKAKRHLRDALDYCLTLPQRAYRIRIFCLTSLYFAVRTLRRAEGDPRLLDPRHKVKITRGQVYRTVATTYAVAPFDVLVRGYYRSLAGTR